MNLTEVLRWHAEKYPRMQPADVVKLVYQNEFGHGHEFIDPEETLRKIKTELSCVKPDKFMPLTEPIGDGYVRVNLAAIEYHGITPEQLNELFIKSSRVHIRNTPSYKKKLQLMEELHYEEHIFSFSSDDLKYYLYDYVRRGCRSIPHSAEYRNAYHPAYRVVKEEYLL